METFGLIMLYSAMVLAGLTVAGGALVAVATWIIDNSGDENAH